LNAFTDKDLINEAIGRSDPVYEKNQTGWGFTMMAKFEVKLK
jgi:hypothetical protein